MILIGLTTLLLSGQVDHKMIILKSAKFGPGLHRIASPEDLRVPAVLVKGDGITIDFGGATFEGTPQITNPNERKGLGVQIEGKNVTIKNLKVRGYKVGLLARDCPGLKIIDSDFSYNWKQHLASTIEKEDESDWQSYHHNEKDEWLEYGAGIYLRGCNGFEVKSCKAEGGQCGLMMTECNKGLVWNSDFSFLSGIGLGMYRSSENRIMYNNIDWCVRGFSYGVYNRGQDSAGILIYEQSNKNIFAWNSVTHGGDGFFLWAGQTTMDSGEGGCNDNLLFGNDFSHAPTNGIEATFSRNNFVNNLVLECWHGIWGGYGFDSKVIGNVFGHNAEAIAWEHGQNNLVDSNTFMADNEGVYIWSNPSQDPNWGYAKKRDTRSRDWTITHNDFTDVSTNVLHVRRSEGIKFTQNLLTNNGAFVKNDGNVTQLTDAPNTVVEGKPAPPSSSLNQGQIESTALYLSRFNVRWDPSGRNITTGGRDPNKDPFALNGRANSPFTPREIRGGNMPFLKNGTLRGWRYMMVDEWGPYDFKRPLLWPREAFGLAGGIAKFPDGHTETGPGEIRQHFEILGPPGRWHATSAKGIKLSAESGTVPGEVWATIPDKGASSIDIKLEYTGAATTDYRGIVTAPGKPVAFGYSKFFAPIDWTIRFYKWTEASTSEVHASPKESALQSVLAGKPVKELRQNKLDFAGASFDPATGSDHFATVATGEFEVAPGDYVLEMTADDGARLWLDGKPLIEDAWKYQGPTLYSRNIRLTAGKHTLRVEHFQIDGYAALKVNLKPKK